MDMKKEILTIKGINTDQVIEDFCNYFGSYAKKVFSNESVRVIVVEMFFFRIKNDVAATVIFELRGQDIMDVHIIVAGGSDMMGFTFGVYKSMIKKIHKFFERFGV
ncbi:MAG: hypothetical protein EAX91_16925 [Candidatus Lokiarchaeota archaeon]|nr:hypothetical protein [Candidatus Lokiarchaeota archaeon]